MSSLFFFNDTATTEIYTLSLHDALPICDGSARPLEGSRVRALVDVRCLVQHREGPFGAREVALERGHLAADRLDRIVQLADVSEHQQQLARRQDPGADVGDAEKQHERRSHADDQPDGDVEAALGERQADAALHALARAADERSEEHTSELQSPCNLVCRLLLEKKKKKNTNTSRYKRIDTVDMTHDYQIAR